jgi:hypothetical protein
MTAKKKASSKKTSRKKTAVGKKMGSNAVKKSPPAIAKGKSAGKDFAAVFAALREILTPYEGRLSPREKGDGYYYVESLEPTYKNRPMFFAGVKAGKNYISYHLLPVYMNPKLNQAIPPELKKRMQGKACFNFTVIDPPVFKQLRALTQTAYKDFKDRGWL